MRITHRLMTDNHGCYVVQARNDSRWVGETFTSFSYAMRALGDAALETGGDVFHHHSREQKNYRNKLVAVVVA